MIQKLKFGKAKTNFRITSGIRLPYFEGASNGCYMGRLLFLCLAILSGCGPKEEVSVPGSEYEEMVFAEEDSSDQEIVSEVSPQEAPLSEQDVIQMNAR